MQKLTDVNKKRLKDLSKLLRSLILKSTSHAGSGHPTSSLSATDLMAGLMFGGTFHYNIDRPEQQNNDRLVFSKGHASPLLYSLWSVAGGIPVSKMMTLRDFGSPLEGHPTPAFPFVETATGSLGQGLSIGLGMALNARYLDNLPYHTYVLLGDSEMAEGSQWEALQLAAHYQLDNLIGVLDVNRLGQCGETMYKHDMESYSSRIAAFGWDTIIIDGHDYEEIIDAYKWATKPTGHPHMIIARTVKGKGVSFLEGKNGWHGKTLDKKQLTAALAEIGDVDEGLHAEIAHPTQEEPMKRTKTAHGAVSPDYKLNDAVPTRNAYGNGLNNLFDKYPDIVSLDAEVCNSTRAEYFRDVHPDRFFEMYIAEQNMVGTALGLSCRGKIPFVSTFAAFFTRTFDQLRMAQYADANIKFIGSHAGVSIGQDGPSQMGLEDIAMFRTLRNSIVLYPCDAVSTERLMDKMAAQNGIAYLRTTRGSTPVIYTADELFPIGGCKVLRSPDKAQITVVAAGITVHEALKAHKELSEEGVQVQVIDLYSVKPLDNETLEKLAIKTKTVLTVEDHYPEGGIGEAVAAALAAKPISVYSLAVHQKPKSGSSEKLLDFEGINSSSIIAKIKELITVKNHTEK